MFSGGIKVISDMKWVEWLEVYPLSTNSTKWSNTFKQFVGNSQRIVWVCLTILWGWRLKVNLNGGCLWEERGKTKWWTFSYCSCNDAKCFSCRDFQNPPKIFHSLYHQALTLRVFSFIFLVNIINMKIETHESILLKTCTNVNKRNNCFCLDKIKYAHISRHIRTPKSLWQLSILARIVKTIPL